MEQLIGLISNNVTSYASLIFLSSGLFGMLFHYAKKRIKKQTSVKLLDYFGRNNPFSSFATFATYAASMSGMLMGLDITKLDTVVVIILGITSGWTIDSGVNTVKE